METLNEAVIDEVRWPRMFAKLRRAGWYASCGCAGCGDCQRAAKRFVRGIARSGRHVKRDYDSRTRLAASRVMGNGVFNVLVDLADQPSIIDVSFDKAVEGETPLADIVNRHLSWQLDTTKRQALLRAWGSGQASGDRTSRLWHGPAGLYGFPSRLNDSLRKTLESGGLYLIYWPRGHYLGKTRSKETLEGRISDHRLHVEQVCGSTTNHRVFWLPLDPGQNISAQEESLHKGILLAARSNVGDPSKLSNRLLFRTLGFTNAKVGGGEI